MRYALIKQYYESPEYLKKLQARANMMKMCASDPLQRQRIILDIWSVDPIAFIEDICFIHMPEFENSIKPMFLFDYQKKIIAKIQDAEMTGGDMELLIDKPRGMGITWVIAAYFYWRWLFTPNWSGFILSRTETEVDDGTDMPSNSIFGKFRFLIKHTPPWLLPESYSAKGKKGTSTDSTLRILNPAISSALIGSTTNSNAGRSRRYSITFIDECFAIEQFSSVWRALQSVSRIKLFVSTVKQGKVFSDFKKLCEESGNYLSLTWKDHPFKDQEWYDEQIKKAEFDPDVMKEIEVDYSVNIRSQYYPEVRQSRVDDVLYNRKLPLYIFFDSGQQDLTVIGWMQFDGKEISIIECYANNQKPWDWYVPFLNPEAGFNPDKYNEFQTQLLMKIRSWNKPVGWFGEKHHFDKESDNRSIAQKFSQYGIRLIYNQYAIGYEPRRHATSILLPKTVFNQNSDYVMRLYDAISNSRYTNSVSATSRQTTLKPVHDKEIADYRAAFENGMVNISRVIKRQREDVDPSLNQSGTISALIKYLRV